MYIRSKQVVHKVNRTNELVHCTVKLIYKQGTDYLS